MRVTLFVILVVVFIIVFIGYRWLTAVGKAFGEKCETLDTIVVSEYKIIESECLGWAGPRYRRSVLFKNTEELSSAFFDSDSCCVYFVQGDDQLFVLDTCGQQFSIQYAYKKELTINEIDSIVVTRKDNLTQKKLNKEEIDDFVSRWNNSKPDGPQRVDTEPYPAPKYTVEVYRDNQVRKFRTSHISVQETTNIWEYSFLEANEDRTTQKLDQIFKMH